MRAIHRKGQLVQQRGCKERGGSAAREGACRTCRTAAGGKKETLWCLCRVCYWRWSGRPTARAPGAGVPQKICTVRIKTSAGSHVEPRASSLHERLGILNGTFDTPAQITRPAQNRRRIRRPDHKQVWVRPGRLTRDGDCQRCLAGSASLSFLRLKGSRRGATR